VTGGAELSGGRNGARLERVDETDAVAHVLSARRNELQYYLAGFGLAGIAVRPHSSAGLKELPQRPAISDGVILLPSHFLASEGSGRGDIHRAAAAHALAHLLFSPRHRPAGNRAPLLIAVMSLIEDARAEKLMAQRYPGLHGLWGRFHVATRANSGLGFAAIAARLARALHDPGYRDDNYWINKGRELFEAELTRLDDVAAFDRVGKILGNDLGQMRMPFDPERYQVVPDYRDDNTLLWDFSEDRPFSDDQEILAHEAVQIEPNRMDAMPVTRSSQIPVEERSGKQYPEWDYQIEALREDWTTVVDIERGDRGVGTKGAVPKLARTRRRLEGSARIPDRSTRLRRLHEGDELDLNAAVDNVIHRRSNVHPDPRIFQRHGRRRRDAAVLLLLDLSASTNDFVPGSFTSVLEAEKRAAVLVAQSLDFSHDRVALHGFASDGRKEVSYVHIKDFDEPFDACQMGCLQNQTSRLSTRMGAALRHAAACLVREHADKKVILLLTDGEPSDVDVSDKLYLVEDARHAVSMAALQGVRIFCVTLDRHADGYVRRIFGARNYQIVEGEKAFVSKIGRTLVGLVAK
jgi:Mg-chelatase subunit ChlD